VTGAADLAARLAGLIRDVPDFPTPGIVVKDITPLLADASAFAAAVEEICRPHRTPVPDKVAGIEARGFILGAPVAQALGVGFVPVRK
jgi:adenine phosphoribosyltransferase